MSRLLQEINENNSMESLYLSAWWLLWLPWLGAVLAFWLARRWKGYSSKGKDNSKEKAGTQEEVESKKISEHTEKGLPSTKVLKELVDELLRVCRVLSRRNSMPELHLAAGMDTSSEAWSIQGSSSTFRPLVILRPSPGYSFHTHSTGRPPAGRIRVALECLCSGEQLLGQTCFLHASGGQLPREQNLLDTLCTGSCLDAKKVIRWVQMLVSSAWLLLPQSCYCQLTALPSSKSCSWQLSSTSGLHCRIEMDLAVQECSSGAHLSLE
ncbi:PREDICTED: inositol 1,4,5-trisphosphate receptor-interacting protein-like 1 [Ficedula albicollis]|nr:PREDICTED: inositol 1,4,5-trisphosphate receptor-interacting protein-like 1 [Ficedula albicollis]XP_005061854.1 PREDICTED: inositol 1,4,5-trisphosphate receptor-interacting protein-like 1 [Ficedula albicollis]